MCLCDKYIIKSKIWLVLVVYFLITTAMFLLFTHTHLQFICLLISIQYTIHILQTHRLILIHTVHAVTSATKPGTFISGVRRRNKTNQSYDLNWLKCYSSSGLKICMQSNPSSWSPEITVSDWSIFILCARTVPQKPQKMILCVFFFFRVFWNAVKILLCSLNSTLLKPWSLIPTEILPGCASGPHIQVIHNSASLYFLFFSICLFHSRC